MFVSYFLSLKDFVAFPKIYALVIFLQLECFKILFLYGLTDSIFKNFLLDVGARWLGVRDGGS